MNKFRLKKCADSTIQNDEIKKAINQLDKNDLCYILSINPNCCFEKEKPLKNKLIEDLSEISFNIEDINRLSHNYDLFKLDLFKLLILLKNISNETLERVLLLNLSINEIKFINIDLEDKYDLLCDLDNNVLIFILVSKNIKCGDKKYCIPSRTPQQQPQGNKTATP